MSLTEYVEYDKFPIHSEAYDKFENFKNLQSFEIPGGAKVNASANANATLITLNICYLTT